ncbi:MULTISPECIES: hypothetical protein [unclassified Clostridioides]|uniref:hypothetical protein n=2 Tax=unclassified Clostridioides TaxID=2635829 RepID=UPI0007BAE46F|nr:hypothetical protein [Clostridioides difficile]MDI7815429.1 hypothetical protein [Clostridioides difficile]CZR97700.1 hypothetical protein CDFC105_62493 [Clostridioides difficile]CZS10259.1 hypothetical protein CDFC105_73422 [Clostridioides difficile]
MMCEFCFIEFNVDNIEVFKRIENLFSYIASIKNDCVQVNDLEYYILERVEDFYYREELDYFWWPTEEENKMFWEKYKQLDEEKRQEYLKSVPWDFETVFSEIGIGDYTIEGCKMIEEKTSKLYFNPIGYPYGGNEVLQEALKAFGVVIVNVIG